MGEESSDCARGHVSSRRGRCAGDNFSGPRERAGSLREARGLRGAAARGPRPPPPPPAHCLRVPSPLLRLGSINSS